MSAPLRKYFWFPHIPEVVPHFLHKCSFHRRISKQTIKYGHVLPKQVVYLAPWEEVWVDMIRPWKSAMNNFEYQFIALTCNNSIICIPEVILVENATSLLVSQAFEDGWLSGCPAT